MEITVNVAINPRDWIWKPKFKRDSWKHFTGGKVWYLSIDFLGVFIQFDNERKFERA